MNATQMSYEFNVVYEAIASNDAPGYEPHEKSLILSTAQEEVLNDILEEGIEENEFNRLAISPLIKKIEVASGNITSNSHYSNGYTIDIATASSITLDDVRYFVNERANSDVDITPISHDFYKANKDNPFKNPDSTEFWRLVNDLSDSATIYIITDSTALTTYKLDYLTKLTPIIVPGVTASNVIDGTTVDTTINTNGLDCTLHHSVHRKIINKAAQNADVYIQNQLGVQLRKINEN